jgi:hypothetical protein
MAGAMRALMGTFVETWKGIAFACGRSERWCRYMARRQHDPLPVFKIGGIVRMNHADLEAWVARQRDAGHEEQRARGVELLAS